MSDIQIAVRKHPANYAPGEEIDGGVQWRLGKAPESVEVRLLWHTTGREFEDVTVVASVCLDGALDDTKSFHFTAPAAPFSYHGRVIAVKWAIEVVAFPHKENARVEIVIAPDGKALKTLATS